jgi:hypothetical protein
MGIKTRQQCRHFRSGDMSSDAKSKSAPRRRQPRQSAFMGSEKLTRALDKCSTLRRKPNLPRRPLEQPDTEPIFEPFQLYTDRPLRASEELRRASKALKIRNRDKGPNRVYIQRRHRYYPFLLSLK